MKKIIILIVITLASVEAFSQRNYAYFAWNYNLPLSNTDFVGDGTSAGAKVGCRFRIAESRFSAGVDFSWATYNEYVPETTFREPGSALTTDFFKYVYNYGFVVSGQYTFQLGNPEIFMPYAGLGLGANFNTYKLYYNAFEEEDNGAGFLVRPEAGIVIRFGERRALGAIAGVSYDFSTNKSKDYDYSNFSNLGFQLGIVVTNR